MNNILDFNKFTFINENTDMSYNDMFSNNMLSSHVGSAMGLSYDARGTTGNGSGADGDNKWRGGRVNPTELISAIRNSNAFKSFISDVKEDSFVNDVDKFNSLKILRMIENKSNNLDFFISFKFEENTFFGVYKNFNDKINRSNLITEFFETGYESLNTQYILKLDKYLLNIIESWLLPESGHYKVMGDNDMLYDAFGKSFKIRKNQSIKITGTEINTDNANVVLCEYKGNKYEIHGDDYYFFNYYFEK